MPPYRYATQDLGKWGSKRLNHDAYILHRDTQSSMLMENLGKITRRACAATFPDNDRTVLVNAICSAREASPSSTAGAHGPAVARAQQQPEVEQYIGTIKSLDGDEVIAEIGPDDDMDRWDVIIPGAAFAEQPQVGQKITCKISRWGTHADISVQIRRDPKLPQLKDFGIDRKKLLSWASQLDV